MKNALRKMLTVAALAVLSLVTCHSSLFGQSIAFYQLGTVPPVTGNQPTIQSNMAFPGTAVGTAAGTQQILVENIGASTASTVVVVATGGSSADFGGSSLTTSPVTNCGGSLTAGQVCTVSVTFTPAAAGARSSTLSVSGSNFTTATIPITGYGISLNATATNAVALVIAPAATLSLTAASCGALVQMGATAGEVVTLPAPIVGCTYNFVITVTNTSASNEIRTDGSSHFLLGAVEHSATGIAPLMFWADGTSIQAFKANGSTTGGLIGSQLTVIGASATQWAITGTNECTATCTTAFTATP